MQPLKDSLEKVDGKDSRARIGARVGLFVAHRTSEESSPQLQTQLQSETAKLVNALRISDSARAMG